MKQLLSKMKLRANVIVFMLALFFALPIGARAASDLIDVVFSPDGSISEDNIAPGDTFSKSLIVTNKTADNLQLAMNVSLQDDSTGDLGEVILVKIKDAGGNLIFGEAGDKNMKDLNGNPFNFDIIGPNVVKEFELIFVFDPNAGNEYQKMEIKFDISAGVEVKEVLKQEITDANDHHNDNKKKNNNKNNITFASNPVNIGGIFRPTTSEEIEGIDSSDDEVAGNQENINKVAGVENECSEWPLWIWILMLAAYIIAINTNFYYEAKEKVRWFFPLAWTAAIFLVWYYFEKCRLYPWYPYLIIIIAIVSFFAYLSWLKRKAKTVLQGEDE